MHLVRKLANRLFGFLYSDETGAIWTEGLPGHTVKGNKRGLGSIDLQTYRRSDLPAGVVSGNYSFATGLSNIVSGAATFAAGENNDVSGNYSFVSGSSCKVYNNYSIAVGYYCQSTNLFAVAMGYANQASGSAAVAIGGGGVAANRAQISFGGSFYEGTGFANGCSQSNIQPFVIVTTNATETPLTIMTGTDRLVVPAKRLLSVIGLVNAFCEVAGSPNTYFGKAWEIRAVIKRDNSNNTAIVGTPTITELAKDADGTPTPSTWSVVSITADDTNEALNINVTGQADTTIRWHASLFYAQVGF